MDCLVVEEGGGLHYSSEELTELSQLEEVVALLTKLKWVDQARVGALGIGRGWGLVGHTSLSSKKIPEKSIWVLCGLCF